MSMTRLALDAKLRIYQTLVLSVLRIRRRHLDLTISCEDSGCFPREVSQTAASNPMVRPSPKRWSTTTDRSDFTVPSPIPSTHLGIWACGSTWRRHTGKHGSSAPHQHITQPTSWPHVASSTWSSTEQVARPATKRFHPSDWRALEACCRPWTWWCNDATALAGYETTMMMWWWWWYDTVRAMRSRHSWVDVSRAG